MRLILSALLIAGSLLAQDFTTRYDVNIGMFGKVGYADLILKEGSGSYEITLTAKTTGTVATLTQNRVETFISKGKTIDGKYIPEVFFKIRTTDSKEKISKYIFNHKARTVTLEKKTTETINGTKFDVTSFTIVPTHEIEISESSEILENYIGVDILSSYLNTSTAMKASNKDYKLVAIGAKNDENNITLSFLDTVQQEEAKKCFSTDIENVYNLHVEPIDKDETTVDILIAYDNDGLIKEALLGEIFWVGKVKANRVQHNLDSQSISIQE